MKKKTVKKTLPAKPSTDGEEGKPRGTIDPAKLYTLPAVEEAIGLGQAGIRSARNKGLKVIYYGRAGYVLGQAIIDHILQHGKTSR